MQTKANEDQFNELHAIVTKELLARVRSGVDCSTQDLKTAIDWLHKNNITGVATAGSPLAALLAEIPDLEPEEVDRVTA